MTQEFEIEIKRKARYSLLGNPQNDISRVWLVCHGYGHLSQFFIRKFKCLDDGRTLIVAPEALSRFYLNGTSGRIGASWMTKEDRENEIADYIDYLNSVLEMVVQPLSPKPLISVLGFSQGVATAARWAVSGNFSPQTLTLWSGGLPPDLNSALAFQRLRMMKLIFAYGDEDEYITAEVIAKQTQYLQQNKIRYFAIPFSGGHEMQEDVLLQVNDEIKNLHS